MDKGNKKDARRLYISCLELYNRRDCCTNAPIDSLRSPLPPLRRGKLICHNPSLPRATRGRGTA